MSANVEAMVREGENALKAGRKEEARALLMKAVELDELNEEAWLWLSAVVATPEDQQTCLENVMAINPSNERARQGLKYLEQQRAGVVPTPPPPTSATAPPPSPSANKTISTSVEWAAPDTDSQPRPTPPKGMELSDEDYDDWVSTLNLQNTSPKPPIAESPFTDDEDQIDEEPDFEIPFSQPPAVKTPEKKPASPPHSKSKPASKSPPVDLPDDEPEVAPPAPYEPLFPDIPDEIRATRMPGTKQRIPIPLLVILALVIGLNIAAAVLLAQAVFA